MATVIIPAHNEGRVIGRLLARLLPAARSGEITVLVVANGCTDNTISVTSSFSPYVKTIPLPRASKHAALAAGDDSAPDFPRVYMDADVELGADDVRALTRALAQPGILAAAPHRVLSLTGSPWQVRWYYDIWARLPAVRTGLFGRGVIAVNQPGYERLAGLPPLLADDLAMSLSFAPHERQIVPGASVTIHPPRTIPDLLRRRVRVATGVTQMEQAEHAPAKPQRTQLSDLAGLVRAEPHLLPQAALFVSVTAVARLRARRVVARGDYSTWLRDESSRSGDQSLAVVSRR